MAHKLFLLPVCIPSMHCKFVRFMEYTVPYECLAKCRVITSSRLSYGRTEAAATVSGIVSQVERPKHTNCPNGLHTPQLLRTLRYWSVSNFRPNLFLAATLSSVRTTQKFNSKSHKAKISKQKSRSKILKTNVAKPTILKFQKQKSLRALHLPRCLLQMLDDRASIKWQFSKFN